MTRDFFDSPWEQTRIVLVDSAKLRKAERMILSCEVCNPEEAEIPFDWVLDRVSGRSGATTDYVLEKPARCLQCGSEIY
jgi:hypothetical protein